MVAAIWPLQIRGPVTRVSEERMASVEPELLLGRYALYGPLAAGGMATVHIGRLVGPVGFSRTVAIKRLHAQYAQDPEFVAMFLDEARLAARVQHPNVVSTLDVVALKGELFLVMEYVRGVSLAHLIKREKERGAAVPPDIAIALLHDVLEGLHAAHEARDPSGAPLNIVHRDVSPHNVIVGVDGRARVLDFGVAKAVGRSQQTREGTLKGKLSYMAPEQLEGRVDRRSDVFAASIVLWELLTGLRLFTGENEGQTLMRLLGGQCDAPSALADVPPALDAVVLRGLARVPEDRFQTAHEMAEALAAFDHAPPHRLAAWLGAVAGDLLDSSAKQVADAESGPLTLPARPAHVSAPTPAIGFAPPTSPPRVPDPSPSPSPSPPPERRSFVGLAGAALAIALIVGAVVWVAARRGGTEPPRALTAPPEAAMPTGQASSVTGSAPPVPLAEATSPGREAPMASAVLGLRPSRDVPSARAVRSAASAPSGSAPPAAVAPPKPPAKPPPPLPDFL